MCSRGRQLEGKVVEISRLQEIFTEKILQQVFKFVFKLMQVACHTCVRSQCVTCCVLIVTGTRY